jgi:hypothetical protein
MDPVHGLNKSFGLVDALLVHDENREAVDTGLIPY